MVSRASQAARYGRVLMEELLRGRAFRGFFLFLFFGGGGGGGGEGGGDVLQGRTYNPKPSTLNPKPSTLNPKP